MNSSKENGVYKPWKGQPETRDQNGMNGIQSQNKEQDKRKNQRRKAKMNSDNNNRTNPIVTSKILLPTELETAISPKPFLATRTEVMRSGIDVPAARNVNPMTSGGTSKFSPTVMTDERRETRRKEERVQTHEEYSQSEEIRDKETDNI